MDANAELSPEDVEKLDGILNSSNANLSIL